MKRTRNLALDLGVIAIAASLAACGGGGGGDAPQGTSQNPPATNPPATNPPATNPPATNPPATNPPVTNPPATNPPVSNPPATNPPVSNPPKTPGYLVIEGQAKDRSMTVCVEGLGGVDLKSDAGKQAIEDVAAYHKIYELKSISQSQQALCSSLTSANTVLSNADYVNKVKNYSVTSFSMANPVKKIEGSKKLGTPSLERGTVAANTNFYGLKVSLGELPSAPQLSFVGKEILSVYNDPTGEYKQGYDINFYNSKVQGWTGLGVTVNTIDDFKTSNLNPLFTYHGALVYSSPYRLYLKGIYKNQDLNFYHYRNAPGSSEIQNLGSKVSHGENVSLIIGSTTKIPERKVSSGYWIPPGSTISNFGPNGSQSTRTTTTWEQAGGNQVDIGDVKDPGFTCKPPEVYVKVSEVCDDFMKTTGVWYILGKNLSIKHSGYKVGFSPEVTNKKSHVDLGPNCTSPLGCAMALAGHLNIAMNSDVINLSLGADLVTGLGDKTLTQFMRGMYVEPFTNTNKAVISVAAGNDGKPCNPGSFAGCNTMAIWLTHAPETRDSAIVVGALKGKEIANYSNRAGALASRYLLAPVDWTGGDGTSYAAPIVSAAAAIIKQKYPGFSSKDIANLLLLSASKDIDGDGANDFEGVSPVYGQGRLDLDNAMKLAETM